MAMSYLCAGSGGCGGMLGLSGTELFSGLVLVALGVATAGLVKRYTTEATDGD